MPYKALVIEDDPTAIEMIEDAITALDHTHDLARCLIDARKFLRSSQYAYILMAVEFPTGPCKGPRRVQNAENLLDEIAGMRPATPPVIVMTEPVADIRQEAEHLMRMAMSLGFKGAKDLIQKPFPTAGRTLDRVIKKVLANGKGRPDGGGQAAISKPPSPTGSPSSLSRQDAGWLTVTQGANLLRHDVPLLDLTRARSRVSTACGRGEISTNGKLHRQRRIERVSFDAWRLKQRDRDLDREDQADT